MNTDYARADQAAAQVEPAKPLTLAITDSLDGSLNVACEIRSRLWSLKDRLFGSAPSNTLSGGLAKEAPASCFADHARGSGRGLRDVLNEIDSLSLEIANRL